MRRTSLALIYGILLAGLLAASPARAHEGEPLRTVQLRVGAYPLVVSYYNEARGGQALQFTIEPAPGAAAPTSYEVTAEPGTTTNAVPVRAAVAPDADLPGGVSGEVSLPVSGQWTLHIKVDGPLGASYGDAPLLASAPPAIPEWLGWLVGLAPLWAIGAAVALRLRPAAARRLDTQAT
jgi:hypothetical protein